MTRSSGGKRITFDADELRAWWMRGAHPSIDDKRALPIYCAATFRGDARRNVNVERVTALVFDFDDVDVAMRDVVEALPVAAIAHTSFSHGTKPRNCFRVLLPIDRPMSVAEHERLWPWIASVFAGIGAPIDAKAKDPARAWFVPCARSRYESAEALEREVFDVDEALTLAPALRAGARQEVVPERERSPALSTSTNRPSVLERASRYLARKDPSIAGSGGHQALFRAAVDLVRGFRLSEADALRLLTHEFNPRCRPPWSLRDLERKVHEATKAERVGDGYLLTNERVTT